MNSYKQWQEQAQSITLITDAFINGEFVGSETGETLTSINPATGEILAEVASCSDIDADIAVAGARAAFQSGVWSRIPNAERKKILLKLADLIEENRDKFALIDTLDMGKPISDCVYFDVPTTVDTFRWSAEAIDKIYGEISPTTDSSLALITREPVGVVAAIVPWNYPLMMASWKIAPALAAGNCVILKPSEKSPLSALYLAELAKTAGIPDGVLNVLPGSGHTVGKALALHPDVDVIAFTGSTKVAGQLMEYAGQSNLKRTWLEAGGKSPCIIFADCEDLEAAASAVALGIFSNQGEVCIATSRLIIEDSIKDEFIPLLIEEAKKYTPGDPLNPDTMMGALVDQQHLDQVLACIGKGKTEGANLLFGGESVQVNDKGCYIQPTIFTGAQQDMEIVQHEIFGPVLAISTFSGWEEAIQLANDSKYGLGAGIWTSNLKKAHKTARELQAGMVWINNWAGSDTTTPFGGVKQSGNARDKSLHSLEKYTEIKTTWIDLS
ncbi:Aldehyde dehydrogenase PuuC [Vibrio aerogenes CECT 7868]|uniref:Aldehyde dehydrogenase n=1 Tax=Vibrio aerogenes CECT 7868 TaxID=1216006 RepID=A0A1M6AHK3_9VIBR|nr:aldehyde dehydrogenase [Vibrio aerogenes]SHI35955.1 Aldehyde dehydrogenase PuuC [Vibrio aerogenes CECT 7868]